MRGLHLLTSSKMAFRIPIEMTVFRDYW